MPAESTNRSLTRVLAAVVIAGIGLVAAGGPAAAAVPDAPTVTAVTPANAQLSVTFDPPASDGGSSITSYTAACSSNDGGAPGTNTGPTSPIAVSGLDNGHIYVCTVLATNGDGDGPASTSSDPATPSTTPDAPTVTAVTPANAQLSVAFDPPASDGGSSITSYTAACSSNDGGAPGTNTGPTSPIAVSGLDNGKTYTCTVLATNTNGDGTASLASNAVTPSTKPDAPAQPNVADADGQITLTFVAPPSDGGSPITSYTADCTSSDGGTPGTNTGPTSPIAVNGLDNGKTYTCTVLATNTNGDGPASTPTIPSIPSTVPGQPAKPSIVVGDSQISVAFLPPASDGGIAVSGYTAECVSSDGGAPGTNTGPTSPIAVTALDNGHVYSCTVLATNTNGDGTASVPSDPVTLSSLPAAPAKPTVRAGDARIRVSFGAPANGGSPITAYTAACTSSNGGVARSKNGSSSPITVTSLTNTKSYTCRVTAHSAAGTGAASSPSSAVVPVAAARGFRLFSGDGGVFAFGSSGYYGSARGRTLARVIGMAATPTNHGYWLVDTVGHVFAFGDARYYGAPKRLNKPIVSITASHSGRGYWLTASDGGVFAYGDAHFYGSTGNIRLQKPIVGMTATPSGHGYWFVASDGGVFNYGDAHFYGSGVHRANQLIVGIATNLTGRGYWLVGANGGVYAFGDALVLGGVSPSRLRLPVRSITSTPSGHGYWVVAGDGGVFAFGDAPFYPWTAAIRLLQTIRGSTR